MSFRFSVIKKNQILTWSLIVILGVVGYMNYQSDPTNVYAQEVTNIMDENLGDAIFVDSTNLIADVKDKNYKKRHQKHNELFSSGKFFLDILVIAKHL